MRSVTKIVAFRDWLLAQAAAFPRPDVSAVPLAGRRQPAAPLQVN
jgi:hypothetical protein